MATWDGHLLGGLFLIIQGLWWIVLSIWYNLKSKQTPSKRTSLSPYPEASSTTAHKTGCLKSWIPQPFYPQLPIEPIAKVITCSVGVFSEAFLTLLVEENGKPRRIVFQAFEIFNSSGDFNRVDKFQHVTMYSVFVLSGIIDLLVLFISLPQATSPLFFTLAFVCQGVLFWFHMGHTVLNGTYHTLHLVVVISCIVFSGLRTHHINSLFVNVALGCSILLQGTWFYQASFLIFKDGNVLWKLHIPEEVSEKLKHMVPMYLSAVFSWHIATIAIIVLITWSILHFVVKKTCIVNWKRSKWQVLQSEYAEKLIEDNSLSDGHKEVENDTEV